MLRFKIILLYLFIFNYAIVRDSTSTTTSKEREHMLLYYINPCPELHQVKYDQDSTDEVYHHKQALLNECQRYYDTHWKPAVKRALTCGERRHDARPKRGVMSDLGSIFGTAVLNFISSQFQSTPGESRVSCVRDFYRGFNMDNFHRDTASSYISLCSDASTNHLSEITEISQYLYAPVWAAAKIHGEILANTANLNVISDYCEKGQMATVELSELMGSKDIARISPENTEMISIDEGASEDSLLFKYWVIHEEKEVSSWTYYMPHLTVGGSILIMLTLIISFCFKINRSNRSTKNAENDENELGDHA